MDSREVCDWQELSQLTRPYPVLWHTCFPERRALNLLHCANMPTFFAIIPFTEAKPSNASTGANLVSPFPWIPECCFTLCDAMPPYTMTHGKEHQNTSEFARTKPKQNKKKKERYARK